MRRLRPGIVAVLLTVGSLAAGPPLRAQQGEPRVLSADLALDGGWLVADIALADLIDPRTASTIDSGLSGVCAYEVSLLGPGGEVVERRVWTLQLEHDIWEDRYQVRGPDGVQPVTSLAAMDSVTGAVTGVRLAPASDLAAGAEYRLRVQVEVRPLGAEAEDRLARYLSRRGGETREEVDVDLGSLFGRVLGGGSDAGRTTVDWTGAPFRPARLTPAGEGTP